MIKRAHSTRIAARPTSADSERGTQPLFIISVLEEAYVALILEELSRRMPVCTLRLGDDQASMNARTVEQMAIKTVRSIRTVKPKGPYYIAGCLLGGTVAYESATQLLGDDEDVAFLGIIDAPCHRTIQTLPDLMRWVKKAYEGIEPINADQSVYRRFAQALFEYSPQTLPISTHVIISDRIAGVKRSVCLDWDNVLPKDRIRVVRVASEHSAEQGNGGAGRSVGKALEVALTSAASRDAKLRRSSDNTATPLQTGDRDTTPLFCIPGAGDTAARFVDLLSYLPPWQPVYGFEPRGLDCCDVPHSTVSAAAQKYLESVRDTCRTKELHLLGHSFGGLVAFEMALRLQVAGSTVTSLTVVDSGPLDGTAYKHSEYSRTDALMEWIQAFELLLDRSLHVDRHAMELLPEDAQLKIVHERLIEHRLIPASSEPGLLRGPFRTFATCLRIRYAPESVYAGPITLVLVDDKRLDRGSNQRQRDYISRTWKDAAPRAICEFAPGNHMSILRQPYVSAVAQVIQRRLRTACSKTGLGMPSK